MTVNAQIQFIGILSVFAVMHPEKYSFHIQGVFNGQKIDTAKM